MNATCSNRSNRLGAMHSAAPQSQQGAILPLVAIGMVVLIAMAGLALDGGHMMLNKTRLQNTADAAALTAAKTLDATADEGLATNDALALFAANGAATGNAELGAEYTAGGITVSVQFSSTLNPFVPGTGPAAYVRVRAMGFTFPSWLLQVIGFNNKTVDATAVAGPSPTITNLCNLAPIMACGTPGVGPPYYGYTEGEPTILKTSAPGGCCEEDDPDCVGPGNFQLIQLGGAGMAVVRDNLAGSFDQCFASTDTVTTQTGVGAGPVAQGFNTRFGDYSGPMSGTQSVYPPDVVVQATSPELVPGSCKTDPPDPTNSIFAGTGAGRVQITNANQLSFNHSDYTDKYDAKSYDITPAPNGSGVYERRIVSVPIGDCSTSINGHGEVPVIGFGCFFLLQPTEGTGQASNIYGQFIGACESGGVPGDVPGAGPGPYIIQLYKDPDATAS